MDVPDGTPELWRLKKNGSELRCLLAELRGRSYELQVWKGAILMDTMRAANESWIHKISDIIRARWEAEGWCSDDK